MIFGLVVNPKDAKPLLVVDDASYVQIHRLTVGGQQYEGQGCYDGEGSCYDGYGAIARATGYPRVHTTDGVVHRGSGMGLCLYTGLCLVAHLRSEGVTRFRTGDVEGDGISSGEPRREPAEKWWRAATASGLASSGTWETEGEEEFSDRDISDYFDEESVAEHLGATSISRIRAYASGVETGSQEAEGNIYTFDSAFEHNLVAVSFKANTAEKFTLEFVQRVATNDVDLAALLALDISETQQPVFDAVAHLVRQEGATAEQLRGFALRQQARNPNQLRLPLVKEFLKNGFDGADLQAALAEGQELRATLGWDQLADLPDI
jgi:hypothetical protein